jgi:hypothetical protein
MKEAIYTTASLKESDVAVNLLPIRFEVARLNFTGQIKTNDEIFRDFIKISERFQFIDRKKASYVALHKANYIKEYAKERSPNKIEKSKMSAYGVFVPEEGGEASVLFCVKDTGEDKIPNNEKNLHDINKYSHSERQLTELLYESQKDKKGIIYIYNSGIAPCSDKANRHNFPCVSFSVKMVNVNENLRFRVFFDKEKTVFNENNAD